jgi:carboxyl-terminal processing protease
MRITDIPGAAVIAIVSVVAGAAIGARPVQTQDQVSARYAIFQAAVAAVRDQYAEPTDGGQAVYGAIDGMLLTLDPHSNFLDPSEYRRMREQQVGTYKGIGISILPVDGNIVVTRLFENSPAYRAGIRRNDILARVGKEEVTSSWGTQDVVDRVRGPKGTTVDISIRRPGVAQLIDLTVERDDIKITTVTASFITAPGTGYVRMQDFSETTDAELGEALTKLKAAGMERLVLDLRDNLGGPLDQAIAVSSRFLKRGQLVVYTRGRVRGADEEYHVSQPGNTEIPLIVMVNRNSASASEIVSGAMQDHDRGLIVGETSFGKALVQGVYRISENAALALTTGRYYTPSGRLIQRPWDGAFDEYITYGLRDQKGERAHNAADLKYTDGGRKVYGGGGIEPDHFVAGSVEGFEPSRFSRMLRDRGAFIQFNERFTKEADARAGSRSSAKYKVGPDWAVTDAMLAEFREFVAGQRVRVDPAAFAADQAFLKAMIKFEVDTDLFGIEVARRNLAKVDPQLQAALGLFEDARKLLARR